MSQIYHVLARCILGAILLFSAVGCDDDDDAVLVDFSVSCSTVSCFNVDETGSFFADDGTEHLFCTWYCGDFNGLSEVFVDLVFERPPGGCFKLASEFIADGICGGETYQKAKARIQAYHTPKPGPEPGLDFTRIIKYGFYWDQ